ncbi:MAG: KTSC domain-containing protein [Anaerolineales bacterium]|nr:KTSC domain-containing protein [Anaerolineales bacterium]
MKVPKMNKTNSKEIKSIGYDNKNKFLFVEIEKKLIFFKRIDEKIYNDFKSSDSKIWFLTRVLVPSFEFEEVRKIT